MGCWMAACVHMPEARIHGWTAMDMETKGGIQKDKELWRLGNLGKLGGKGSF